MANIAENTEIQAALSSFMAERGQEPDAVAKKARVNILTLNAIQRGRFNGISEGDLRRVWSAIRPVAKATETIETANLSAVIHLCDKAKRHQLMVGITGDTGLGKTTALQAYCRRKNVFYVVYEKSMKPRQFFVALAGELGINYGGSIHEMVSHAADELNSLEKPLIIIDEAGKLPVTLLMYLHDLRNRTQTTCGIVLAGMPYFKENLTRWVGKQIEGASEFYGRVQLWHELQRPTRAEIKAICALHGITDPDKVKELQRHRDFRNLYNAILLEKVMSDQI